MKLLSAYSGMNYFFYLFCFSGYFLATTVLPTVDSQSLATTPALLFPSASVDSYIEVNNDDWQAGSLDKFTICFWINLFPFSRSFTGVFSYSSTSQDNLILIGFDGVANGEFQLSVYLNGGRRVSVVILSPDEWCHLCIEWLTTGGELSVFKDGEAADSDTGFLDGSTIPIGPSDVISLVLGQDQDNFGGGFALNQAFVGELYDLNMWSSLLDSTSIQILFNDCTVPLLPDLVAWNDEDDLILHGNVIPQSDADSPCHQLTTENEITTKPITTTENTFESVTTENEITTEPITSITFESVTTENEITTKPITTSENIFESAFSLECTEDDIEIALDIRSMGVVSPHAYFDDHSCIGTFNGTHIILTTGLNQCDTKIKFPSSTEVMYYNNVWFIDAESDGVNISRSGEVKVTIKCTYLREKALSVGSFTPNYNLIETSVQGFGDITFSMGMFKASDFAEPYAADDYPIEVDVGQRLYVEVSAHSSTQDLELLIASCKASASDNPLNQSTIKAQLIEAGCPVERTVVFIGSGPAFSKRFSFEAFVFVDRTDEVYLHCEVILCRESDPQSTCQLECTDQPPSIQSRSSSRIEKTERNIITVGPLFEATPRAALGREADQP